MHRAVPAVAPGHGEVERRTMGGGSHEGGMPGLEGCLDLLLDRIDPCTGVAPLVVRQRGDRRHQLGHAAALAANERVADGGPLIERRGGLDLRDGFGEDLIAGLRKIHVWDSRNGGDKRKGDSASGSSRCRPDVVWRDRVYAASAARALSASAVNAAASWTARSARILRSTSMPALCSPFMNVE